MEVTMEVKVLEQAIRPADLSSQPKAAKLEVSKLSDDVAVEVITSSSTREITGIEEINQAINVVNITASAVSEVGKLVDSVEGIVKQVADGNISPERVEKLNKEQAELVAAIKVKAISTQSNASNPGLDKAVDLEIQALSKSLQTLFPDDSQQGLEGIRLTPPEFIIQTVTIIAEAKKKLAVIGESVEQNRSKLENTVKTLDVAEQNALAAGSSVRDLDAVLKNFSTEKLSRIGSEAGTAHTLTQRSLELLR